MSIMHDLDVHVTHHGNLGGEPLFSACVHYGGYDWFWSGGIRVFAYYPNGQVSGMTIYVGNGKRGLDEKPVITLATLTETVVKFADGVTSNA
jgi:hypothetical protein